MLNKVMGKIKCIIISGIVLVVVLNVAILNGYSHNIVNFYNFYNYKNHSSKSSDDEKFETGIINGVKLKIPDNFLISKIVYENERRDNLNSTNNLVTKNSKIDNFSILLRLSDLQPISSDRDRDEWSEDISREGLHNQVNETMPSA